MLVSYFAHTVELSRQNRLTNKYKNLIATEIKYSNGSLIGERKMIKAFKWLLIILRFNKNFMVNISAHWTLFRYGFILENVYYYIMVYYLLRYSNDINDLFPFRTVFVNHHFGVCLRLIAEVLTGSNGSTMIIMMRWRMSLKSWQPGAENGNYYPETKAICSIICNVQVFYAKPVCRWAHPKATTSLFLWSSHWTCAQNSTQTRKLEE